MSMKTTTAVWLLWIAGTLILRLRFSLTTARIGCPEAAAELSTTDRDDDDDGMVESKYSYKQGWADCNGSSKE
jgi:hypothetical protein